MSRKAFGAVEKTFASEVERAFGSLAREFDLAGPEPGGVVMQVIAFAGKDFRVRLMLDQDEMCLVARLEVEGDGVRMVAELGDLVQAAGLGTRQQVRDSAHNLGSLQKTLETQASFVRRILPLMNTPQTHALMQKANARTWHVS
jgi:hypothetical protein